MCSRLLQVNPVRPEVQILQMSSKSYNSFLTKTYVVISVVLKLSHVKDLQNSMYWTICFKNI